MQSFTPGKAIEWDVDFNENGGGRFVGTERWFVDSVDSSSGTKSYYLTRVSTGTIYLTLSGPPTSAQITGRAEKFVVTENSSGVLRIPVCSRWQETGVNFARDTAQIARYHDVAAGGEVVLKPWLGQPGVDTSEALLRQGAGLTSLYHYHLRQDLNEYWRYSLRLKGELPPSPPDNYFQWFAMGDTSLWDYSQDIRESPGQGISWKGSTRWKVVRIDSSTGTRTTTVERRFTGTWSRYSSGGGIVNGTSSDDTSYVTVKEDGSHKIILDFKGYGPPTQYVVLDLSRYYSLGMGDEILVLSSDGLISVTLRRGLGMVRIEWSRGGSMTGSTGSYVLVR